MRTLIYAEQALNENVNDYTKIRKKILKQDVDLWNAISLYEDDLNDYMIPIGIRLNLLDEDDDDLAIWAINNIEHLNFGCPTRLYEDVLNMLVDSISMTRYDDPELDLLTKFKNLRPSMGWELYLVIYK